MTSLPDPPRSRLDYLLTVEPPWIYAGPFEPERRRMMASYFYGRPDSDVCVRILRGEKMRTDRAIMNEIGAALQIRDGNTAGGENYPALEEYLMNLGEWLPAEAYVLDVEEAEAVACDDDLEFLAALLVSVHGAAKSWSQPITDGGQFDRPARPFHMLMNYSEGAWSREEEERVKQAAATYGVPLRLPGGIWMP